MKITDKEFADVFNKCLRNGVRIYPVPTSNGTNKAKAKVKLIVDYGSKQVESSEVYSQEDNMSDKIVELYCHIAERL